MDAVVMRAPTAEASPRVEAGIAGVPQLEALAFGFLRLHALGNHVAMAFWGLWLLPFGILVRKSGFIPRWIGVLLIVGCFAYLTVSLTGLVSPTQNSPAIT